MKGLYLLSFSGNGDFYAMREFFFKHSRLTCISVIVAQFMSLGGRKVWICSDWKICIVFWKILFKNKKDLNREINLAFQGKIQYYRDVSSSQVMYKFGVILVKAQQFFIMNLTS